MNWFIAKLVFRIICGNGNHPAQFDEQLRLISAEDEFHAFLKARILGDGDQVKKDAGIPVNVKWKFIDVIELYPLASCADGAEVVSVKKEEADAEMYIRNIKSAATQLLQRSLHQFTHLNSILIDT